MIGTTISHYEITEQLGGGGMGVVYTARDKKLDRLVALKFLPPELSRDADANARFMQEAKAASALDHPNICTIYEVGEANDGRLFIAMAHYEGQTLKYRLGKEEINEEEAIRITRQVTDGLRAAHKKGIIHRDVKPANIMVTDDGLVKILDFGLAKLPGVLSLTQAGSTLGTAAYMSPEQIQGGKVDGRTDLWSLGVVLYQMIAGRRPFEGDYEQALTYAILNQEVELPVDASQTIREVLAKLLDKDPEKRYASAESLLEDLPETSGPANDAPRQPSREPLISNRVALSAGIVLVIALIASTYFNFFNSPTQGPALSEMTIGVVPFTVRGQPDLSYLGEGIVDLLSVKLDGAGEIRALDPNALLGVIAKEDLKIVTPDDAKHLANRLGAGRVILGNVTQVGSEVQITASLYGAGTEPEVDATVTAADESEISSALDGLAKQLVAELLTAPSNNEVSLAAVTTSSFPALKAYLSGLQLSRTGRYPEAAAELEKAVEMDSSFAMAWSALAWTYGWIPDPRETDAWMHALANSASLPWRSRTLIEAANYAFRTGDGEKAMDLYRSVLAEYPNDTEALHGLGEAVFHYNPLFGRPHAEADQYFERASALAPDNLDYLQHQYDSAVDEWEFDRADSIAALILQLDDREDDIEFGNQMHGIMMRSRGDSSWSISGPGSMSASYVSALARQAATHVEDLEAAVQVLHVLLEPGRYPDAVRERATVFLAGVRIGQGRLKDALQIFKGVPQWQGGGGILPTALLYGLPVYPASDDFIQAMRQKLAAWDTTRNPIAGLTDPDLPHVTYRELKAYHNALLALRVGDLEAVETTRQLLNRRADSTSGTNIAYSLLRSIDAVQSLETGEYDEAIKAVDDAQLRINWRDAGKSPLFDQFTNRFVKAEALRASGRLEEAIQVYRSVTAGDHVFGILLIGPEYLGVADAYEQLGQRSKAIEFYSRLVHLWRDCDPELVPIRDEAQRNLDRLLVESVKEPT